MKKLTFFAFFFIFLGVLAWGVTFEWVGEYYPVELLNWENPNSWKIEGTSGNALNSYPGGSTGRNDTAIINGGSYQININTNIILEAFIIDTGCTLNLVGNHTIKVTNMTVNEQLQFSGDTYTFDIDNLVLNAQFGYSGILTLKNLTVNALSSYNGTLNVTEMTTLNAPLSLTGTMNIVNLTVGSGDSGIQGGTVTMNSAAVTAPAYNPNQPIAVVGTTFSTGIINVSGRDVTITATGTATINAIYNAASLTVNGNSHINADITTVGNQHYNGTVTLNGNRRLISTTGTITTSTGNVSAQNGVIIEAGSSITIGSGGITAGTTSNGVIRLESGGGITIGGPVSGYQLIASANTTSGIVAFGNSVVNITNPTSNSDGSANDKSQAPIYVRAHDFTASGNNTITPGSGELCLELGNSSAHSNPPNGSFSSNVVGQKYHIHDLGPNAPDPSKHLVYYNGAQPVFPTPSDYHFVQASGSSDTAFYVNPGMNIYICNVGTNNHNVTFTVNPGANSGYIEIQGSYTSTGLTLHPGGGGVHLYGATVHLDTDFNTNGTTLTLVNADSSITATTVTLGAVSSTGGNRSLTITGNAVFNGAVSDVTTLNVSGTSTINANITTTGAQTYTGAVTLGGAGTRTLQGTTVTMSAITGAGRALTITGNAVFNGAVSDVTTLNVSGTSTIGANITTTGAQTYTGAVTLGGGARTLTGTTVTLGAITGGGNALTIAGNAVLNGGGSGIGALQINGTGNNAAINGSITNTTSVTINATGTTTINAANITTTAGTGTPQRYYGPVALGANVNFTGASGSTIRFDGTVNGAYGLTVTTATARFSAQVGGTNALASVTAGTARIVIGVRTTGNQTYSGAVTLGSNANNSVTLTANAGSLITFSGTVGSNNATARALTITNANVRFDGAVGAASGNGLISTLTVNAGAATINANVSTSGNQSYAAVNLGSTLRIFASSGGSVTVTGIVTGTNGITVNTLQGITMNAANALSGNVTLNNTQTGTLAGNVSFTNVSASVNLTAVNNRANGTITVNQTGALSVTSASTPASGSISLTTTGAGNNITLTGAITTGTLSLIAAGTVNIGSTITVSGGNNTVHNANAGVYIAANSLTGSGAINLNGNTGWACAFIESNVTYTGTVSGNGIHYHTGNNRHIVYRPGTDSGSYTDIVSGSYLYIRADDNLGGNLSFFTAGIGNVYIIDIGSSYTNASSRTVNFSTVNGYIEIRGAYTSSGALNLNPGTGSIRLNAAAIDLTNSSFDTLTGNKSLTLLNATDSSIRAVYITLGNVTADNKNKLTLNASNAVGIFGVTGTDLLPLGEITLTAQYADLDVRTHITTENNIIFNLSVHINLGGIAKLTSKTGNINFDSTNLPANSSFIGAGGLDLTAGGNITVSGKVGGDASSRIGDINVISANNVTFNEINANNITVNNSGQYTQNGAVNAGGRFRQTGSGPVSLYSNITAVSAERTNAVISFERAAALTTGVTLAVPSTGGTVRLASGVTGNLLTLKGGSGETASLELDQDSGTIGNIDIAANSFLTVRSNKTITQTGAFTLTLENGATLDTSAGSWHMSASAQTPSNDFAGVDGVLILGTEAKLIGGNVNLKDYFTVSNADWAAIAARGDVEIEGSVNFSGVHPQLIIEMAGPGSQKLTTAQPLGSLHVEPGSTTNLTHDLTITGQVQIRYSHSTNSSAPHGVLNAGVFNIVMQAGLNGTKDAGPVKLGRWIILNAPETISARSVSTYTMNAFRQEPEFSVTFQKIPSSGDPVFFEIIGNTAWQKFICNEPGAVIQFSTHPHQHVFIDKFEVRGTGTHGGTDYSGYITLTRLSPDPNWKYIYDGSPPGTNGIPNIPASRNLKAESESEKEKFWNFNLITPGFYGQRLMDIGFVTIYFSHAWNQRIPIATKVMDLNAIPFYMYDSSTNTRTGYFNYDWVEVRKIIYSYAEDSNGNGRVDRIRVQTNVSLNGNFTRFNVHVEGFKIDTAAGNRNKDVGDTTPNGFDRVNEITHDAGDDSSFYIYLQEPPNLYDGQIIKWWVTENTDSLMDSITQTMPVGDPVTGDSATDEHYTTINTIPPRVSYALTLPAHNQTFVQMSQPVQLGSGKITGDRVTSYVVIESTLPYTLALEYHPFDLPPVPYNVPVPGGESSYLLTLDSSPSVSDLARFPPVGYDPAGYYFTMDNNFRDLGVRALDWNDENVDETTYMYYPSPRYPVDWNYSGYATYKGNGHIPSSYGLTGDGDPANPNPDTSIFLPPNRVLTPQMVKDLEEGRSVTPSSFGSGVVNRRITDVLISRPPVNNDSENYFAWPVWARYQNNANPDNASLSGNFWGQRNTDNGVIWVFDGAAFLEARGFDLQARLNSALTGNLEIYWTTNMPAEYRVPHEDPVRGRSTGGMWLTYPAGINKLFYYFVPLYDRSAVNQANAASANPPLYNFTLNGENSSGKKLEFIFRINGSSPSDLFIARLDIPRTASIPENWYTLVRPFGFDIQDIRLQRGGVTVLNNVINSDSRENALIRYHLVRPGRVTIQVYTLDGTLVKSLRRSEYREAGEWTDVWDGTNNSGRAVARGMYFVRVVAPDIDEIRKIMVVR